MLTVLRNLFKPNKSSGQIQLGRWALNNENVKSVYANSDHCGDVICGNPKRVKQIINNENNIKVKLPKSNSFHTSVYINNDFSQCC
tara:strand:+ start:392 stop:649 length:258 start_codon:yes stop_codon:yes gene_type:complete